MDWKARAGMSRMRSCFKLTHHPEPSDQVRALVRVLFPHVFEDLFSDPCLNCS